MLQLVTGQPGNGKTLYTLYSVYELAKADGRQVFYFGIKLKPGPLDGWIALERGEDWHKCPAGSIVVIDEGQKVFRPRAQGAQVPEHVAAFETHRHEALDIFVMTQHPTLVDAHVRKLVGRHHHMVRRFGFDASTRYQWEEERDVKSDAARGDALKKTFKFPKEVYGWYESAKGHTIKRDFPLSKIAVLLGAILLVILSVYFSYRSIKNIGKPDAGEVSETSTVVRSTHDVSAGPWDADMRRDRVPGVQASQPLYDSLMVPVAFPKIAGCASLVYGDGKIECWCNSQQGTKLSMTVRQCLAFLKDGYFDFTDATDRYEVAVNDRGVGSESHRGGVVGGAAP